jgi:hypothetical protein
MIVTYPFQLLQEPMKLIASRRRDLGVRRDRKLVRPVARSHAWIPLPANEQDTDRPARHEREPLARTYPPHRITASVTARAAQA